MSRDRRWIKVTFLLAALPAGCLLLGCGETLGPGDGCIGWYQGFYILSSPESVYVRVELDFTWTLPDSALILTPRRTLRASRMFERGDPQGLAIVAAADDDVISGWYLLRAFYGGTERIYEEHVVVRDDFLSYNYGVIAPVRGEMNVVLEPTMRWGLLHRTGARVTVYADSLREQGIYTSGTLLGSDSLRVPYGVLEGGIRYYWTLEVYDWGDFVPDCPAGYYYMDFFDNGLLFVGWFTTTHTLRQVAGGQHDG